MKWTLGTTFDNATGYLGIVAYREGTPRSERLVQAWPDDATAAEIADALERLAADLRKQN